MKTQSPSASTSSDSGVSALRPIRITKLKTPVQGYDGGLPVAAVEGGVEFLIPPWLVMKAGDLLEVFWGDLQASVWSKDIEPEDENELVKGVIDEGHIRRGTPIRFFIE